VKVSLAGRQPLLRAEMRISDLGEKPVLIDASRLKLAGPLELTATAALTHVHAGQDRPIVLRLPASDNVASYLQRMNLLDQIAVQTNVVGRTPLDFRTDRSTTLLEVTSVSPATQQAVLKQLRSLTLANIPAPLGDRVVRGIAEILGNALEHGSSDTGTFIAAQIYSGRTTRQPRLEVAVADTGIGVLEHLRRTRHQDYVRLTSAEGLRRALRKGVTGTEEHRGYGLADLFAGTGEAGKARVVLRSGNGLARVTWRGTTRRVVRQTTRCNVAGTWVLVRVTFHH